MTGAKPATEQVAKWHFKAHGRFLPNESPAESWGEWTVFIKVSEDQTAGRGRLARHRVADRGRLRRVDFHPVRGLAHLALLVGSKPPLAHANERAAAKFGNAGVEDAVNPRSICRRRDVDGLRHFISDDRQVKSSSASTASAPKPDTPVPTLRIDPAKFYARRSNASAPCAGAATPNRRLPHPPRRRRALHRQPPPPHPLRVESLATVEISQYMPTKAEPWPPRRTTARCWWPTTARPTARAARRAAGARVIEVGERGYGAALRAGIDAAAAALRDHGRRRRQLRFRPARGLRRAAARRLTIW